MGNLRNQMLESGTLLLRNLWTFSKCVICQLAVPYCFCTREMYPTCEFAEDPESGPTVTLVSRLAAKYNMVIVCPILERDSAHGDTIWNTAIVIDSDGTILG